MFGFYKNARTAGTQNWPGSESLRPLIADGAVEVLWQPPTDDMLDAYGERLLEAVHRRRVRRLVIDGLTKLSQDGR